MAFAVNAPGSINYKNPYQKLVGVTSAGPPAVDNSPAGLRARYGQNAETFEQHAIMNGWNLPQPQQPAPAAAQPPASAPPPTGGGSPAAPAAPPAASPANPYFDLINQAFDAQSKRAEANAKSQWSSSMADRGFIPAAAAAQDAYGRTMGQVTEQMAIGRAGALSDAQGRYQAEQFQREQWQAQQAAQQRAEAMQQAQLDWQKQQAGQEQAYRQQQFDWQRQQGTLQQQMQQNELEWQKQQQAWQTEDRKRQEDMLRQAQQTNPTAGNPYARLTGSTNVTGYTTPNPPTFGNDAPTTSTGHAMGGGAGLGGAATGGSVLGGSGLNADGTWAKPKSYSPNTGATKPPGTFTAPAQPENPYAKMVNNAVNGVATRVTGAGGSSAPAGYQTTSTFRK